MTLSLKHYPDKPFEHTPDRLPEWDKSNNYVCQAKIDGWRIVIILGDDGIEFISRHNKSQTKEIEPELRVAAKHLAEVFPKQTQLDAEWLSRRSCSKEYKLKPSIFLFDVMRHGPDWILGKPYEERHIILRTGYEQVRDKMPNILLPPEAEPGKFAEFYETQKGIYFSEGVVVKHKRHKIIGNRQECVKNPEIKKVKYRSGSDGEMRTDFLHRKD